MAYEASPRESSGRRGGMRYNDGYQRGRSRNFGQGEYRDDQYTEKRARDYDEAPRPKRPRDYTVGTDRDRERYGGPRYDDRHGGSRREDYGGVGEYDRREVYDRYNGGGRGYSRGGFRSGPRRGGFSDRGPPRRDRTPPAPSRVLGVFGLSARTEERDLYEVFSEFGRVDDIQMVYDALTGRSRGFGFIYFEDIDSAIAAREGLSRGLELHGRIVRIDYSKTESAHAPTPGVFMGKDRRRGSYLPPGRFSGRGFNSRPRYYGGRGGPPRSARGPYGSRSRSRSRSRSPRSVRSYSMSPPPRGRRVSAQGGSGSAAAPARPRNRTQSSSRSRSPPAALPSGSSARRRTNHRVDDGYVYADVNGNNAGVGSLDGDGRVGRQRDDWSDAGSASSLA